MSVVSVGTIDASDYGPTMQDVKDPLDPTWPWNAFAKHSTLSSMHSLHTLSVARTWRIASAVAPTAGVEGCLTLHYGQPCSPATLLLHVMPLKKRAASGAPEERLESAMSLTGKAAGKKGTSRLLKYGPICRAGAHIVCVTLNGAHVVGSPMHVMVLPAEPEPSACELRPAGGPSSELSCSGKATAEIPLMLQLRDRYGNRCSQSAAADAISGGLIDVDIRKLTDEEVGFGGGGGGDDGFGGGEELTAGSAAAMRLQAQSLIASGLEPRLGPEAAPWALAPAAGSPAAAGYTKAKPRPAVAGDDGPGSQGGRGLITLGLTIAAAGVHVVSATYRGAALGSEVAVGVAAGPPKASASTAHDAIEGEGTAASRCVAGVARGLVLVARDSLGNATTAPPSRWAVGMRSAASDDGAEGSPKLGFAAQITPFAYGPSGGCVATLATYRVSLPGDHELLIRYGGRFIKASPSLLKALPPAWGHGLQVGTAGEPARFWVRLRPEGGETPGSAAGRKVMHTLEVEAMELDTHERAQLVTRQVGPSAQPTSPEDAAEYHPHGDGDGEVAEVNLLAATASGRWALNVAIDGQPLLGSPFPWEVRAGVPGADRCLVNAPWVGTGKAAAGVLHEGVLVLRDAMGNECETGVGSPQMFVREEFGPLPPAEETFEGQSTQPKRPLLPQELEPMGGGKWLMKWRARNAGSHTLIFLCDDAVLRCSMKIEVHADGACARATFLEVPKSMKVLPLTWTALQLRCRDESGNPSELNDPTRLRVTCDGLASAKHLVCRERPGLDGAHEVLVFGEPVGLVTLNVTLDGAHVINSPATLDICASSATAGRCYAFGPGLGSKGSIQLGTPTRFTIVACDATGTRRAVGGDAFKVSISPLKSANHLALRVTVVDNQSGSYTVTWKAPFSGTYLVNVSLRGLPIFGSPFKVKVIGGGQYSTYFLTPSAAGPSHAEIEDEIASVPSPTLDRLHSVPAHAGLSPPQTRKIAVPPSPRSEPRSSPFPASPAVPTIAVNLATSPITAAVRSPARVAASGSHRYAAAADAHAPVTAPPPMTTSPCPSDAVRAAISTPASRIAATEGLMALASSRGRQAVIEVPSPKQQQPAAASASVASAGAQQTQQARQQRAARQQHAARPSSAPAPRGGRGEPGLGGLIRQLKRAVVDDDDDEVLDRAAGGLGGAGLSIGLPPGTPPEMRAVEEGSAPSPSLTQCGLSPLGMGAGGLSPPYGLEGSSPKALSPD